MGSVHARGDTFLTFGLKALTETNTSRLATVSKAFVKKSLRKRDFINMAALRRMYLTLRIFWDVLPCSSP
jgi:hypothetical protein